MEEKIESKEADEVHHFPHVREYRQHTSPRLQVPGHCSKAPMSF